ncbi:GNAT family N-acetyltransferase [Chitinolyticbacter albus]|uniref:GNAT family N-acetyltransferase n=1 Tax=Chitinolyticbacter albus TaxID=2961951 RepID=UPI00210E8C82|nr:GNAT family N-acetyltransferase [Chitinolyticbacter albus]
MSESGPIEWMIGPATLADAPAILALQRLAYRSEAELYDDWTLPPLTQTLAALQAEFASGIVLKAEYGSELVGSVRALRVQGEGRIGRLIVHPERQRQGIGSALLRAIESACGTERLVLFTGSRSEGNLRLYQRHGYVRSHTAVLSPAVELVYLQKQLD